MIALEHSNKLRICLLSYRGNPFCGGQGIYVQHLAEELVHLGHQVSVLVGPPYPTSMDGAKVWRVPNHIFFGHSTAKILSRVSPNAFLSPLNCYEYASSRIGVFPEIRAFSLRAFLHLREIFKHESFDILHDNQCLGYGLLLVKNFGIPLISTIHHPLSVDRSAWFEQPSTLKQKIRMIFYYPLIMQRIVANRMDRIVTVSQDAALQIQKAFGISEERIRVVYNGLDASVFRPISDGRKIPNRIIFVGNVGDRKKGVSYLLEALPLIDQDAHLVVVDGGTPARVPTQEMIRRHGLQHRISVTGRIRRDELVSLYASSQVAVVPSLYEGFGFPAAEAMACELPVVATTAGALPEVVGRDGEAGILVPPRNPSALASAVNQLLNDPGTCQRMGKAARQRILRTFTWRKTAEQLIEIYREVIDAHC
jgi:glycosyltransferase involved in cell wall biosynthesis